ncbi:UDP-GlcNAc:undecaprenyl-phosphate GlcNAc-1-phosphate transferase [Cerasibacillus quisquiliarum]|uniref:Undecaprenyl-phosphate alpha-N-acetylglucosaminyl 1-phosphate transferase n=1 Tax=Cerasibacillus quisquiliarum TaxID=227865 RepID=A0A511V039_9BACI|nr:MraY family glycosyltransferase [Cerasibacillus quisquiliarum]MBB5147226.1 UDP-GlcNAc:undecaprenyl-phosphate GlcNAc-1-phosphate transferase [Cerasibacillus quisquiliarum]GEN32229.1 undecaprenyl-phosphate alpha-N-acetylglucosaminyl 1-phosphate transferase [Cerasibacillus quisquiliarum]
MWNVNELVIAFIISCMTALIMTPLIIKIVKKYELVDQPDGKRKLHHGEKPSLGGLAIFIGVAAGYLYLQPSHPYLDEIIIGAFIMILTGVLDDIYDLKPFYKLIGQVTAAAVVVSSGLIIDKLTIPFAGIVYLGNFGILITILWIVGASNAINLIDGLDGLAAGVSTIALSSIMMMAIMDYRIIVVYLTVILIGGTLGFLVHNFYPAKIFMGDTGALFLGYAIAVVSMFGLFKNVALFSFIVPFIVIAIPIYDTILAIIRRTLNKQGIATADRQHIHYRLMSMGYSHRTTVLILYGFSLFFGIMAIVFNSATLLASLVIMVVTFLGIQLVAEMAGITYLNRKPVLRTIQKLIGIEQSADSRHKH